MSTVEWTRSQWEFAGRITNYELCFCCPLCHSPGGYTIPCASNADGFVIEVPVTGDGPSTVTWRPCGHSITVAGRLDQPASPDSMSRRLRRRSDRPAPL